MADHATPNLPSRDFGVTERFYAVLGFETGWRDEGWMILDRGTVKLEFFPYPDLDPMSSSFSCCLRLDDIDTFYAAAIAAGLPETCFGHPRLNPPRVEASGMRIAYMVDPDGTLLRLVQNKAD
jgi:catechol 2,3-dioxygenase-like lactoylglutathione lyase family enzyme